MLIRGSDKISLEWSVLDAAFTYRTISQSLAGIFQIIWL